MTAVLVIAGTDSSGGAGLSRDVATLAHFGVEALPAVTAVTAQTDREVAAVELLPPELVQAQIAAALATRRAGAVKIGMLGSRAIVAAVAAAIPPRELVPLVLDPVLAATSGGALLDAAGCAALGALLLPRTTLLTPNIAEAAALLGVAPAASAAQIIEQGRALCLRGAAAVLMKGGHASGALATDWLVAADGAVHELTAPRLQAVRRGTGCALASAIAAGLAARLPLAAACQRAKAHVTGLLRQSA
ncbi:MAG TPA: bifunctional hydroxymethylpyrimidine kinase/phosphomethylpyrimidine kinase [Steroidobacteraceae bacterium]|nr:bifunctional hydroxymethylpyrimidine kinase/phosphomethylpyrimidine kinase [Steroidobacteraceae bacterium]